jgi:hypothetical protein
VALMARRKGTTFTGASALDTDKGAPIFRSWAEAVADDLGLIFDKLTGQNAEATPFDHRGGGRGCPLSLPLANQTMDRSISIAAGSSGKYFADTYVIAVPVFVPRGEDPLYQLDVDTYGVDNIGNLLVEVRNSSWGIVSGPAPPTRESSRRFTTRSWSIQLSTGLNFIAVRLLSEGLSTLPTNSRIKGWRLYPERFINTPDAAVATGVIVEGNSGDGNQYPVATSLSSGWSDFYDEQFTDSAETGLDPYFLTRANQQVNALLEYVMGGVVPGNNTRQLTTEWRNNRAVFANEPEIDFSQCVLSMGSCLADGTASIDVPLGEGMLDWGAPQLTAAVTPTNIAVSRVSMMVPRFATATPRTKACILAASNAGTPTSISATINATGTTANFVRMGATNFYTAQPADFTFSAGTVQLMAPRLTKASNIVKDELQILGYCLYFDP